jgi:hypothetical protein
VSDLPLLEPGTDPDQPLVEPDHEAGAAADERARRVRRTRWLLTGALAAVLVVIAALLVTWRLVSGPHTSLTAPETVAGLHRDTTADAVQTADYLRDAIAADASLVGTVGAVYTDPAGPGRSILLFGGTGSINAPAARLDSAFGLLNDQTGSVTGIHEEPAGPLGGVLKCGTSNGDGGSMTACGWADDDSLVLGLFPGRPVDQAADLLRQLRTAMEHHR